MNSKGQRKANGSFELAETPSHLMRRCHQYFGDLYAQEAGARDLTKQQFTVLAALEHHDGVSQTALVEATGIDRSTLAEMVRRMLDRGLLFARAHGRRRSVRTRWRSRLAGRKALRSARIAADRAEKALLDAFLPVERQRFMKSLAAIASAADGDSRHEAAARPRTQARAQPQN